MAAVLIDLRVSTTEQSEAGLGLEAQRSICTDAARRLGREVKCVCQDHISGSTRPDERPGLLDAIAALAKGDLLLVAKRDRLSRAFPPHGPFPAANCRKLAP